MGQAKLRGTKDERASAAIARRLAAAEARRLLEASRQAAHDAAVEASWQAASPAEKQHRLEQAKLMVQLAGLGVRGHVIR